MIRLLCLCIGIALASLTSVWSQTVTILNPAANATGVPLSDSIVVRTSHDIDVSETRFWVYGNVADDPLRYDLRPNVYVIDASIRNGLHDTLDAMDYRWGIQADIYALDDTTVIFKTENLQPGVKYYIYVADMPVIVGGITTYVSTADSFMTAPPVPRPMEWYTGTRYAPIFCGDSVWVRFSEHLSPSVTPIDSILSFVKVTSTDSIDTVVVEDQYSTVPLDYQLNMDSTFVRIWAPNTFHHDSSYFLKIRGEYVSGDPLDNQMVPLFVRKTATVTFQHMETDTLPDVSLNLGSLDTTYDIALGQAQRFHAPQTVDCYQFAYWYCPAVPGLHMKTNHDTTVDIDPCLDYPSIHLEARYNLIVGTLLCNHTLRQE